MNPELAIIYCQFASYSRDYIVKANGVTIASYLTQDGSEKEHVADIKTNNIINVLAAQINSPNVIEEEDITVVRTGVGPYVYTLTLPQPVTTVYNLLNKNTGATIVDYSISGNVITVNTLVSLGQVVKVTYSSSSGAAAEYTAVVTNNTMYVTRIDDARFDIETVDSADGNDLIAIQDKVQLLINLPPNAPEGFIVKVQNKEGFDANAYWLKAEVSTGSDQSGSKVRWVETVAQGSTYKLDVATMPHNLISEANGTFTLEVGDWKDRRVGDDLTNPFPSFIGNKIASIGSFQNRILFTSGEAAIFSRTNVFFDFFRETTQASADSDPIDAFADSNEINNLIHHTVLDGDIVFFSENAQFLIKGNEPITSATIVFKKVTSYPLNTRANPAVTGESVMFSFSAGKYAGIREMFTDSITDTKRARPITEHVAEYIEGVPIDIISSPNINTLLIRTDTSQDTIYVYDWLWAGDQKVQSAFHKWKIGGSILFAKFISDKVYFVIDRGTGIYIEQMPIGNDTDDNGLTFPIRLDQRVTVTANWNGERWEWYNPYEVSTEQVIEFVRGDGTWEEDKGTSVIFENEGTLYWSYDDIADWQGGVLTCTLTAGTTFNSRYIPTKPSLKDFQGRAMGLDRFTIGKVTLNYESIGNITVYVRDEASRREWKYEYNGRRMGAYNNRVGFAPLDSGTFSFPIRLRASGATFEIVTDDYRPFILRDMEWEGMFQQRGKRL